MRAGAELRPGACAGAARGGGAACTCGGGGPGAAGGCGGAMGRKLDPTKKEKRGPGRKARKQRGAEVELARFLPPGKSGPARPGVASRRSVPPVRAA